MFGDLALRLLQGSGVVNMPLLAGEQAEVEILFEILGDAPEDAFAAPQHGRETLVALLHAP